MIGDVVRWTGANGLVSGTIVKQGETRALVQLPNGKQMKLSLEYIKKHNPKFNK